MEFPACVAYKKIISIHGRVGIDPHQSTYELIVVIALGGGIRGIWLPVSLEEAHWRASLSEEACAFRADFRLLRARMTVRYARSFLHLFELPLDLFGASNH